MLTPPTLNMWANWYMQQWDFFVQMGYAQSLSVYFKAPNQPSYMLFRKVMHLIDLSVLEGSYSKYNGRAIVASVITICLMNEFGFDYLEQIERSMEGDVI